MSLICRLLGHKPPVYGRKGWWSPGEEYGVLKRCGSDGIDREHCRVEVECPRCGEKFVVARVHLIPTEKQEREIHALRAELQSARAVRAAHEIIQWN